MLNKIKRIHFSQTVDVVDPATREVDKKDAKNFMVNQTSILLERDQLLFSPFDDMVWKQMMDYQVVRITQSGKPVYTSENEHALDAFMLTILGFTLEFPDITQILEEVRVARRARVSQNRSTKKIKEEAFGGAEDVFRESPKINPAIEPKDNPNWHMRKTTLGYSRRGRTGVSRRGSSRAGFRRSTI